MSESTAASSRNTGSTFERIDFAGGAKLAQAMSAGAIDISVATGADTLFVIRGAPERAVAAFGNDLNSLSIVARTDDTVRTLDDIKGKTIGTTTSGSFTSWIARQIAVNHGWGPDGIKLAYLGQMSGIIAGLMAKNVDAIVGTTASALVMQKEGRVRIIVKAGDELTNFIANVIYASEPMMKEHPDELRRFLAAWFDTMRFIKANKAETIRITQKDTKLPDDVASAIYDAEVPTFFTDGHFDRAKLAAVKQALDRCWPHRQAAARRRDHHREVPALRHGLPALGVERSVRLARQREIDELGKRTALVGRDVHYFGILVDRLLRELIRNGAVLRHGGDDAVIDERVVLAALVADSASAGSRSSRPCWRGHSDSPS